jgi:hypothetical protein
VTQITLNGTRKRYGSQFSASIQVGSCINDAHFNCIELEELAMGGKWVNIFVASLVIGLSGCASMNADECMASDWFAIGHEDGSRGYTSDQFGSYRKSCAKHGVSPDFSAYQSGRDQGLVEFCQPGRGFNYGVNGGQYRGVCSVEMEAGFADAYRAGYQLYTLRSNVNAANSQIYNKKQELEVAEKSAAATGVALVSGETTTEERVLLLVDLKQLSEHIGLLESEIESLIIDRAQFEHDLQLYEQTAAAYNY